MSRVTPVGWLLVFAALLWVAQAQQCKTYTKEEVAPATTPIVDSTMVVDDAFDVTSIEVSNINIDHPRVGFLKISLVGAAIGVEPVKVLLKDIKSGGLGQNLSGTSFSDDSFEAFPEADGAPFTGTYQSLEPLTTLANGVSELAGAGGSQGQWTLHIVDLGRREPDEKREIQLKSWSIVLCANSSSEEGALAAFAAAPAPEPEPNVTRFDDLSSSNFRLGLGKGGSQNILDLITKINPVLGFLQDISGGFNADTLLSKLGDTKLGAALGNASSLQDFSGTILRSRVDALKNSSGLVSNYVQKNVNAQKEALGEATNLIQRMAGGYLDDLKGTGQALKDAISSISNQLLDGKSGFFRSGDDEGRQQALTLLGTMTNASNGLMGMAQDFGHELVNSFGSMTSAYQAQLSKIQDRISGVTDSYADTGKSLLVAQVDMLNGVLSQINKAIGDVDTKKSGPLMKGVFSSEKWFLDLLSGYLADIKDSITSGGVLSSMVDMGSSMQAKTAELLKNIMNFQGGYSKLFGGSSGSLANLAGLSSLLGGAGDGKEAATGGKLAGLVSGLLGGSGASGLGSGLLG